MQEAMAEFRKSGSNSAETMAKLNKAINTNTKAQDENTKAQDEHTQQTMKAAEAMEKFKDTTRAVLSGLGSAAQGARDNREDFRSLKPAVGAAGTALKNMTGGLGTAIDALGQAVSGISSFGIMLGPKGAIASMIGMGLGSVTSVIGKAIKAHGKDVVDAGTAFMNFSLDETQRVVGAFQELSKIGGVTGNSFQGLQQAALETGLSMDSFARVIAKNSRGLALAGGSVTQGMRAVVDITKASKGFEDQFLKLGIGFEEQRDLTAQFLSYQRTQTGVNLRDTRSLADASKEYILQLDQLARLTGMSRQEVASRLEQQNRELKFGAVLADAGKRGKSFADAISGAATMLEAKGLKTMAQGFKDSFDNLGTKEAQLFFQATGGAGPELVNFLERTGDLATFMERLGQATAATYETMGGTKQERMVGGLGTYFDPVYAEMRLVTNGILGTAEAINAVGKEQKDAKNNQSDLTNTVVGAQKSLRNFAVGIDSVVVQQFPKMAGAVGMFTDSLASGASALDKILGTGITRGAPPGSYSRTQGAGPPGTAGGPPGKPPMTGSAGLMGAAAKNLNPGNLRFAGQDKATVGTGGFAKFETVDDGLVALARQLDLYLTGKSRSGKRDTISSIISAYAPPNENDTRLYIEQMARFMGKGADEVLPRDPATMAKLMVGIIGKESMGGLEKGYNMRGGIQFAVAQALGIEPSKVGNFQYGGIASGPKSGYAAMLHGTEAVVPLAGGRSIPVEMTGMTDTMGQQVTMMGEQLSRFDTMIGLLQNNVDISRKLLSATR